MVYLMRHLFNVTDGKMYRGSVRVIVVSLFRLVHFEGSNYNKTMRKHENTVQHCESVI